MAWLFLPIVCQIYGHMTENRPEVTKYFHAQLKSEHEISTVHKTKILTNEEVYCFKETKSATMNNNKVELFSQ